MTVAHTIAFLLISFMAAAIVIKLGHHIYVAICEETRYYDGRDYFDEPVTEGVNPFYMEPIQIEILRPEERED